jgi:hypothetical protein
MQRTSAFVAANNFFLDAMDLALRLDHIPARSEPQIIPKIVHSAVRQGRLEYAALLRRRESLTLTPQDAAIARIKLNHLRVRLDTLEKRSGIP